jgi:hypothetical protein
MKPWFPRIAARQVCGATFTGEEGRALKRSEAERLHDITEIGEQE